jgi:hypothetical protein
MVSYQSYNASVKGQLKVRGNEITITVDDASALRDLDEMLVEVSIDGPILCVRPIANPGREEQFRAAMERFNRKYGSAMNRLAGG